MCELGEHSDEDAVNIFKDNEDHTTHLDKV